MRQGREYWGRHVTNWRRSGLSQSGYCREHGLVRSTFCSWISRAEEQGRGLVDVTPTCSQGDEAAKDRPIEVVVGERYVLRLWRGTNRDHAHEVLTLLEERR